MFSLSESCSHVGAVLDAVEAGAKPNDATMGTVYLYHGEMQVANAITCPKWYYGANAKAKSGRFPHLFLIHLCSILVPTLSLQIPSPGLSTNQKPFFAIKQVQLRQTYYIYIYTSLPRSYLLFVTCCSPPPLPPPRDYLHPPPSGRDDALKAGSPAIVTTTTSV